MVGAGVSCSPRVGWVCWDSTVRICSGETRTRRQRRPVRPLVARRRPASFCICTWCASQLETFDPKPDAPEEIRGTFGTIETALPGVRICEHLPQIARMLDRTTVIRSMSHPFNIHSAAYTLTGVGEVDVPMELNPYDRRHWPYIGSVLEYLEERARRGAVPEVPRNMALPFQFSSRAPEFMRAGPYAAFLGAAYDPVWTEFEGEATRTVNRWRGNVDNAVRDPFYGISSDSRFLILRGGARARHDTRPARYAVQPAVAIRCGTTRPGGIRRRADPRSLPADGLLANDFAARADCARSRWRARVDRERYGMTLFGQATLAARRMIEAGSRLVTVFWDEFGPANTAWDTHFDHFSRLKDELLPGLDQAFSSLVLDLETRGMLDSTLVACISEHGRTLRLEQARGGGRGHWSQAYCGLFAGGGIKAGQVIGRTDKQAGLAVERPISPKDILRTIYHQLGVDPETLLHDRLGRPLPLVSGGELVREMLA